MRQAFCQAMVNLKSASVLSLEELQSGGKKQTNISKALKKAENASGRREKLKQLFILSLYWELFAFQW